MRRSLLSPVMFAAGIVVLTSAGLLTARLFAKDPGWAIVENRVWLERMPRTPRDMIEKICFIHDDGERVGFSMRNSDFRFFLDTFFWFRRDDGHVRMTFPQDQSERIPVVKAWKCADDAPEPFELCLQMQEGEQRRLFYSREDWIIGDLNDALADNAPWNSPLPFAGRESCDHP